MNRDIWTRTEHRPADVLILPMSNDLSAAIALATKLRGAGIRTQLMPSRKR